MSVAKSNPKSPTRKRRWFQYSLRTLLVVMLMASVVMSWFAMKMQQARRQREAVEAIKKLDGQVWYDYEVQQRRVALATRSGHVFGATGLPVFFRPVLVDGDRRRGRRARRGKAGFRQRIARRGIGPCMATRNDRKEH